MTNAASAADAATQASFMRVGGVYVSGDCDRDAFDLRGTVGCLLALLACDRLLYGSARGLARTWLVLVARGPGCLLV